MLSSHCFHLFNFFCFCIPLVLLVGWVICIFSTETRPSILFLITEQLDRCLWARHAIMTLQEIVNRNGSSSFCNVRPSQLGSVECVYWLPVWYAPCIIHPNVVSPSCNRYIRHFCTESSRLILMSTGILCVIDRCFMHYCNGAIEVLLWMAGI